MHIESTIERFIVEEIMFADCQTKIDADQSLIDDGILDSLALLRLMSFLQQEFGVTIEDGELIPDNFQTINIMKTFLKHKMQSN